MDDMDMADLDDLTIIDLYHRREERAIFESDKKYGVLCRSIALRLLGFREDAEECVNDTWLAAWNKMPPRPPQEHAGRVPGAHYAQPVHQPLAARTRPKAF